MRVSASNTSSMVGYRRQKYLLIWGVVILVLITVFYFYSVSDGKSSNPLKELTLIFTTTGSKVPKGISLKTYDNTIQFDSVSIV